MKVDRNRLNVEWNETRTAVQQSARVWYVRVTTRRLTTLGIIEQGHLQVLERVWLVSVQIGAVSHHVIDKLIK